MAAVGGVLLQGLDDLRIEIVDTGEDHSFMIGGQRAIQHVLFDNRQELLLHQFAGQVDQWQVLALRHRMDVILRAVLGLVVNRLRERIEHRHRRLRGRHRREDRAEPLHELVRFDDPLPRAGVRGWLAVRRRHHPLNAGHER